MSIIHNPSYNNKHVQIKQRECLFKGFLHVEKVHLSHRLFQSPEFSPVLQRELIHRPQAAGVLIYSPTQQRFALIEQFRIGALDDVESAWQLEIIAGVLDGNEKPEHCIQREALEEAGCEIDKIQRLFSFYPSAGACSELFHLYVAEAILPQQGAVHGQIDEGENIQLHILDYQDLAPLMSSGRLRNAPVIMALQWLQQQISA